MKPMTISAVARMAGVGIETIRFYEREGLMEAPPRTISGYRQYSQEAVQRLQFIQRAKYLGFTLKEIEELLSLRLSAEGTCEDVRKKALAKISDIEERVLALQRMKRALTNLAKACTRKGSARECPIIEAIWDKEAR